MRLPGDYLEALIDAVPDGIVFFDKEGCLQAANEGFRALYEVSGEISLESYGELLLAALGTDGSPKTRRRIQQSIADPPATVNFVLERCLDRRRFISVHSSPAHGPNGEPNGRVALHRDVTRALELMVRSEERADLPDINPIALVKCDALGRVLFQNVAADRFLLGLGLSRETAMRMFPKDYRQRLRQAIGEHEGAQVFEHRYKNRILLFTLSPHPRQPHCMILVEDVTAQRRSSEELKRHAAALEAANREIRQTQAALVQSEKMASLGNLVAGIAHEINTPVGAVSSSADVMRRALGKVREALPQSTVSENRDLKRALEVLERIGVVNQEACERIVKIVRGLRNFARLDEAERKRVDLHEGLESTLTILHHELKNRIEVVRAYGELPEVQCFPSKLNQVFMNLLVNALQAIEGRGTITIQTESSGGHVKVAIRDTGLGIGPDIVAKIFDPGFTTKGVGVGSGLGLAICYQIAKEHGGQITVDSVPGEGSTFTLILPRTAG